MDEVEVQANGQLMEKHILSKLNFGLGENFP